MKPQLWQLEASIYPWTDDITTRFGDVDALGHLNNVAIASLFEEARVRFQFGLFGSDMHSAESQKKLRLVVAQSNFSYLREGDYPEPLRCGVGLAKLGSRSFVIWSTLWQCQKAMAFQECVMVMTSSTKSIVLSNELRELMQPWVIQQPIVD